MSCSDAHSAEYNWVLFSVSENTTLKTSPSSPSSFIIHLVSNGPHVCVIQFTLKYMGHYNLGQRKKKLLAQSGRKSVWIGWKPESQGRRWVNVCEWMRIIESTASGTHSGSKCDFSQCSSTDKAICQKKQIDLQFLFSGSWRQAGYDSLVCSADVIRYSRLTVWVPDISACEVTSTFLSNRTVRWHWSSYFFFFFLELYWRETQTFLDNITNYIWQTTEK